MTPNRKVTAAGLAGALTTVLAWLLAATTKVEVPPEVAAAITTILTVGTAYLVPESE